MSTENPTPDLPDQDVADTPEAPEAPEAPEVKTKRGFAAFVVKRYKLIIGLVIASFVLVIFTNGRKEDTPKSSLGVRTPPAAKGDPNMVDPRIADQLKAKDAENAEKLLKNPDAMKAGVSLMPRVTNEVEDPLASYAKASAGQGQPVAIPVPPAIPPPPPPPPAANLAPAPVPNASQGPKGDPRYVVMAKAMRKALDGDRLNLDVKPADVAIEFKEDKPEKPAGAATPSNPEPPPPTRIAKLGDLFYAVMDLEANSDYSSFVQATVVGGPMSGAKLQGAFRRTLDRLEIQFSRASFQGRTLKVSAIATNPDDPQVGLATEVNQHYLSRFGGLFVSAFLRGYGDELKREGTMVTVNADTGTVVANNPKRSNEDLAIIGASEVADELGDVFKSGLNRPPTVIVAANTPIGVLMRADVLDKNEPVVDIPSEQQQVPQQITPTPFQQVPGQAPVVANGGVPQQTIDQYARSVTENYPITQGPASPTSMGYPLTGTPLTSNPNP